MHACGYLIIAITFLAVQASAAGGASTQTSTQLKTFLTRLGAPSKSVVASDRIRSANEPLLVYWRMTSTAPLGVGPAIPGTLVANFRVGAHVSIEDSALVNFTFLGVVDPKKRVMLERSLRSKGWVKRESKVKRPDGTPARVLLVDCGDGRMGTVTFADKQEGAKLQDGRPSPNIWMFIEVRQ